MTPLHTLDSQGIQHHQKALEKTRDHFRLVIRQIEEKYFLPICEGSNLTPDLLSHSIVYLSSSSETS